MKTLEELRNEVMANAELKQAFTEALLNGTVAEFILAQGVTATQEEIEAALHEATAQTEGELSDEEMSNVAGGSGGNKPCPKCNSTNTRLIPAGYFIIFICDNCNYNNFSG